MAKLINFSDIHTKRAEKNTALRQTAEEYNILILIWQVLKFLCMLVSIASGFAFFYYKLAHFISGFENSKVFAVILAIMLLFALEFLNMELMKKTFKLAFKRQIKGALSVGLFAAVFLFLSFHISINGIYLAMSDTHEQQENTAQKYEEQTTAVKAQISAQVRAFESDIAALVGPAWNGGNLTTEQTRTRTKIRGQIDSLYKFQSAELRRIKEEQAAEQRSTQSAATEKAEDYSIYVLIILCLEVLTNGTCQFYDNQIFNEVCPKERKKETLKQFVEECRAEFKEMFETDINTEKALYLTAIAETMDTSRREELTNKKPSSAPAAASKGKETAGRPQAPQPKKAAGFTIPEPDPAPVPPSLQDGAPSPVSSAAVLAGAHGGYKQGTCALCGKPFTMRTTWQKYCSEGCKLQYNANLKGYPIKGVAPNYTDFPNVTKA